jgi:hypothetical protein
MMKMSKFRDFAQKNKLSLQIGPTASETAFHAEELTGDVESASLMDGYIQKTPQDNYRKILSRITSFLFIGSAVASRDRELLKSHQITHILNLTRSPNAFPNDYIYEAIPLRDTAHENLTMEIIQRAVKFINKAKNAKGRVLVHCEEGISRASAVAIAYLMSAGLEETKNSSEPRDGNSAASDDDDAPLKPKMSYRDAYDYVLKIRPTAAPNLAFVVALTVWERQNCPGRETASEVEALTGVLDQLSFADSHRPV